MNVNQFWNETGGRKTGGPPPAWRSQSTRRPERPLKVLVVFSAVALLSACNVDRACEKARLSALDAYTTLSEAAAERKLAGVDTENWDFVTNRVELLQSSFATPQVTWKAAEKSQGELKTRLASITTNSEESLEVFKHSVNAAFETQERFSEQCR